MVWMFILGLMLGGSIGVICMGLLTAGDRQEDTI